MSLPADGSEIFNWFSLRASVLTYCASNGGPFNNAKSEFPRFADALCSFPLSFYIPCSLEFGVGKRHLSLGCLRWWRW